MNAVPARVWPVFAGLLGSVLVVCVGFWPQLGAQSVVPEPIADPISVADCPPRGLAIDGTVVRVKDGDTIVVKTEIEFDVRLIDCWAPESRTRNLEEKRHGIESKTRMQQLANSQRVRVFIPTGTNLSESITLGRVLGRVWLMRGDVPQSPDLSAIMVREQLATPHKVAP